MTLRFGMGGGNLMFNAASQQTVWFTGAPVVSNAPVGRADTYAFANSSTVTTQTNSLGSFTTLIAGYAVYPFSLSNNSQLIAFLDPVGAPQCDVRMNAVGQFFFTRNATVIGGTSTTPLIAQVWNYIEFKAIFSTAGAGTCEVRLNGVVVLTSTALTNATGSNNGGMVLFHGQGVGLNNAFMRDFYVLDTGTGLQNTYLGDVTGSEIYPNGAGTFSAWSQATNNNGAASPPPFAITSVAGGNVFTRTTTGTGEAANAYVGLYFTTSGFTGANGTFLCTASTTTTITLLGASLTGAGSLAFQAIVQAGVHGGAVDGGATTNVGTRPNGDSQYISDNNVNDRSDFVHQTLVTSNAIQGVIHLTCARKDDAGSRTIAQITVEGGAVTETGPTQALGSSYLYYMDVMEADPNTSALWTVANFNATSFGVKLVS